MVDTLGTTHSILYFILFIYWCRHEIAQFRSGLCPKPPDRKLVPSHSTFKDETTEDLSSWDRRPSPSTQILERPTTVPRKEKWEGDNDDNGKEIGNELDYYFPFCPIRTWNVSLCPFVLVIAIKTCGSYNNLTRFVHTLKILTIKKHDMENYD